MRIALISTCAVSVPPSGYGGTELIIAELGKMLTQLGHDVTTFATGDSTPGGRLQWLFERPMWPPTDRTEFRHAAAAWRSIARAPSAFDVVHAHQSQSLAFASLVPSVPTVYTLHHHRDESLISMYRDFPDVAYVAVSQRQADLVPEIAIEDVILHGIDPDHFELGAGDQGFVAFLGRFAPEKGPHVAIDAARRAHVPLRMGGGVHPPDRDYFEREVKWRLGDPRRGVDWLGELSFIPKVALLRGARALLFPIDWEEPFGIVMIESMLVGTPVIGFPRGSVPEVVEEGVTGFIVRDEVEMAARIRRLDQFDRVRCRERARERWSSLRMAREHEALYERLLQRSARARLHPGVGDRVGVPRVDGPGPTVA